jgi:hypothetical protein
MIHETNGGLEKITTSFSEFVELSKKMRDKHGSSCDKSDEHCSFYGDATSYDVMYKRCYDGYNARAIADARRDIGAILDYEREGDELRYSGESLDIPTYLSGDMRCWWAESGDGVKRAKIHITYAANCVGGVRDDSFLNHGGCIAVLCDVLSDWADTKITCTFTNEGVFNDRALQVINMKDYSEAVDIPRIGVSTHPSFFRRICFAWFEGFGDYIKKKLGTCYGGSRTGSRRYSVVGDQEFFEWLRIDVDEMIVDLPAADLDCFKSKERAADWLKSSIDKILSEFSAGNRVIKLY